MTKFTLKSVTTERGVTLVELLVYIAIVGVVMGAIYTMFYRQQDSYLVQDRVALLQQNLRGAMTVLANDLQMAGHYTCYEQREITTDVDDDTANESFRPILSGDGSSIMIFKVDTDVVRPLVAGEFADVGKNTITVNNGSLGFNTSTNRYGVMVKSDLSRAEFFEVTGVGGSLTVTVRPHVDSSGRFVESYFAGATGDQSDRIAPVEIIIYTLDGANRLWRSNQMVAEHISGFQLQYAVVDDVVGEQWVSSATNTMPLPGEKPDMKPWDARDVRRVEVTLTGKIKVSDKLGEKDRTLSSTIKVRNLGMETL